MAGSDLLRADVDGSVVRLVGEVDLATIGVLRRALETAARATKDRIVLDLSELRFIGTTGLNELQAFVRECPGVVVVLEKASPQLRRMLDLVPIQGLEVGPSQESA
jgi:anti-sigma B factor antagonist